MAYVPQRITHYNPEWFVVERAESVASRVGQMVLGHTRLGKESSQWVEVELATFSYSFDYTPDDNGTLIIGSESATVTLSFKGEPAEMPLYPSDRVRVRYGSDTLFLGTVDGTTVNRTPVYQQVGYEIRVEFSASIVGTYALALTKEICYGKLPKEKAIDRIRRWVTVRGWQGVG